jgi:hypothetical protein
MRPIKHQEGELPIETELQKEKRVAKAAALMSF